TSAATTASAASASAHRTAPCTSCAYPRRSQTMRPTSPATPPSLAGPAAGGLRRTTCSPADPPEPFANEPPGEHEPTVCVKRAGKLAEAKRLVTVEARPNLRCRVRGKPDLAALEAQHNPLGKLLEVGDHGLASRQRAVGVEPVERAELREA